MRRSGGFTLLEVVIALAVIAIAMGALIKSGTQHAQTASYLRDRTLAHWVAMNRVAELQLAESWPGVGESNGRIEMAGREWWWRARVEATFDEDVRRLEVEVARGDDAKDVLTRSVAFLPRTGAPGG